MVNSSAYRIAELCGSTLYLGAQIIEILANHIKSGNNRALSYHKKDKCTWYILK